MSAAWPGERRRESRGGSGPGDRASPQAVTGPQAAMGPQVVAGLDVGGTKLAVRVETLDGTRLVDAEFAATGWGAVPAEQAADWLTGRLAPVLPTGARVLAVGIGAQGCDAPEIAANLEDALAARGLPATVVNDGALLVPAAGLAAGIGVVAGTGSVAIGTDKAGGTLLAGGWGWVLGDEGGGAAIVREATRAALAAHDSGEADDGLLAALQQAYGVATPERLARAVNDDPTPANWAPHAPAVFTAADGGSVLAAAVIEAAAAALTCMVSRLVARGAVGSAVVAAGSVITRQARLAGAFRAELKRRHPDLDFRLLAQPPTAGAVALARRRLSARDQQHGQRRD